MTVLLLGVVAILLVTLYQIVKERKLKEAIAIINATIPMTDKELALRIKVNQLIAENVALENKNLSLELEKDFNLLIAHVSNLT